MSSSNFTCEEEKKMSNTINDLYLKYVNEVGQSLESDRYFQYLFEMVQAGNNVLQQKNQILHKVVDERWLTTIEESLDAINNIIDKPRRFITSSEEVVPVALAKKITADSVRHLSMNTQFIASNEDGDIQPTRVLNVTTEESYDLYENRFIYHLIQRLVTFIDKRTDVIFWSTGDEIKNTMTYQSKVDDAYEEIEYKIEMSIKNRQSFAENDTDNMQVFMRIDRVRRLVLALRNSSFCSLMSGCAKVRSPIQRTNLMMKDPNYRTCYKLWQFLESYDEVGYTIDVQDTALEFDEEYLFQLYTNLITNYTVFKSLLEDTPRNLEEVESKKQQVVKPKFIKKIEEQIVDDYNIPDVEIRQVIIEEVTQAQLDAEAKLAEESEARKTAEEALEEMESQMMGMQQQLFSVMEMNTAAEEQAEIERQEKEAALQKIEEELKAKEEALKKLEEEQKAREEALKQLEEERIAKEAALTQAEATRKQADAEIEATKQQAASEMESTRKQAASDVEKAKQKAASDVEKAKQKADAKVKEAKSQAASDIEKARHQATAEVKQAKAQAESRIKEAMNQAAAKIEEAKAQAEARIKETKSQASYKIQEARTEADQKVQEARTEADQKIQAAKSEADQRIQQTQAQTAAEIEAKEIQLKKAQEAQSQAAIALEKAQRKANANSLSKYIVTALKERKNKAEQKEEEAQDDKNPDA
jgi:hypothetical protein